MGGLTSLRLRVAIAVAAFASAGVSAQVPTIKSLQTGTATISGRVVDARSGEPLGNVVVRLSARIGIGNLVATTDNAGFYHFANLAENEYTVHVLDPLYLRTCYGATDAAQVLCGTVTVLRNQHRTGIDFLLTLGAVLRGRVVDQEGRAVGGADVRATPAPSMPSGALPSGAQTKADGSFEILGLASGDTILSLDMPVTADTPRAPTVFYPGVVTAGDAEGIRVTAGLVTSGITFRFPKIAHRTLTARISAPTTGATAVKAWLYRVEPRMVREIALSADGTGSVPGLLEGRYFIAAHAQGDGDSLVAFEVAEVVPDTVELALLLQEPGRITGRVVAERGGLPPLSGVRVAATWTDDGVEIDPLAADEAEVGPDGSFRIDGLFGLRSLQLLGLAPKWRVQSIRHGRNEISTTGVTVPPGATLDITITIGPR